MIFNEGLYLLKKYMMSNKMYVLSLVAILYSLATRYIIVKQKPYVDWKTITITIIEYFLKLT